MPDAAHEARFSALVSATSREWVAAYFAIVVIALVAVLGFGPITALVIALLAVMTLVASRACATDRFSYWTGLRVVATINPTGETFFGQAFVLPALAVATAYSWLLALAWLLGGREAPREAWLSFLRGYRNTFDRSRH